MYSKTVIISLFGRQALTSMSSRRIDFHHHIFPPATLYDKAAKNSDVGWTTPPENLPWSPEKSIEAMDALGIDTAILSFPVDLVTTGICRKLNAFASDICKQYPDRFGFFATLPPPNQPEALDELAYALDVLQADGVSLTSSYGCGDSALYIGDDSYTPLWQALNARQAVVFLHGGMTPSSTPYPNRFLGLPITEVPNETYKAAAHLVVTGKKRLYPDVRIILAHLGGSTPFLVPRVAALSSYMGCKLSPEQIIDDFRTFYYETALSSHKTTLAAMTALVPADRLLFGTDFPAVTLTTIQWYNDQLQMFCDEGAVAADTIMCDNALRLLPRFST